MNMFSRICDVYITGYFLRRLRCFGYFYYPLDTSTYDLINLQDQLTTLEHQFAQDSTAQPKPAEAKLVQIRA
jgi:hypothetical protein